MTYDHWKTTDLASEQDDGEGCCPYWDDSGCYCVFGSMCSCDPKVDQHRDRIRKIFDLLKERGDDGSCTTGEIDDRVPF